MDSLRNIFEGIFKTLGQLKEQILIFGVLALVICIGVLFLFPQFAVPVLIGMAVIFVVVTGVYVYVFERRRPSKKETESPGKPNEDEKKGGGEKRKPEVLRDENTLRHIYLTYLFNQTSKPNLEGIYLRDAGQERDARIKLQAIYTALLTLTPEEHEKIERGQMPESAPRRLSALAQLNEHRHLMLLGDPGSGKSTFVNFAALCLAGAGLNHPEVNLKLLTSPLPDDEGENEEHPQPWEHSALLPVRVILKDFVARCPLETEEQVFTLEHLWKYLGEELKKVDLNEYVPLLRRHLEEQGGLLLFDGLDEVPEASQRRQQIIGLVEAAACLPNCRVLVTSRVYAYRSGDWKMSDFTTAVLDAFSRGQITRFVNRWYAHLAQLGDITVDEAGQRARDLKDAIYHNPYIFNLAVRPLLLTLMAGLHAWQSGKLPEKREDLYHQAVELLLDRWQRRTVIHLPDGKEEKQPSLEEFLDTGKDNVRRALNKLAFDVHSRQPKEQPGTADITEKDLVSALLDASPDKSEARPRLLAGYLRERAGLLVARGAGVYAFPHRTFQEYLAACHLTETDFPDYLAKLTCEDAERWREVTLLAAAKVARGSDSYWNLAEELCSNEPPQNPEQKAEDGAVWGAFMAGALLAESASLMHLSLNKQRKLDRVRHWLVYILQSGSLEAVDRAAAGNALAHLDDPRFDPALFSLPRSQPGDILGFVHIPAGRFLMGSAREDDAALKGGKRQHELELPDFYLARYPVTVAQFKTYLEASGEKAKAARLDKPANHPITRTDWYQCLAYCNWLTRELRKAGKQRLSQDGLDDAERVFWVRLAEKDWEVMLPSEAEWEKAARGGLELYAFKEEAGRIYPWGDVFEPDCANSLEMNIGQTSAVGCFPKGASRYGLLDMSGNVWEWTRSLWSEELGYPYVVSGERENLQADGNTPRVQRGGSYSIEARYARCSYRNRDGPSYWYYNVGFRVGVFAPSYR